MLQKKKRRQMIKIILMEFLMVASVAVIVVVATLAALGFFVSSDGSIEQSGLAQIHSIPTGANVALDGATLFARTNLSRTMSEGTHDLKISRDKYDMWENQIQMKAGVLLRLYYPRLFLLNRSQEIVQNFEKEFAFYEPSIDRNSILYAEKESTSWRLMDIKGDEIKTTVLDMADVLSYVDNDGKFLGRVEEIKWSKNADRVLVKLVYDGSAEWILVNLKDVKSSLNLTRTFGMDFDQVEMADSSANRLFVLENQNLRRISTTDQEISRVLLNDVISFANSDSSIIYVAGSKKSGAKSYKIGIYRDGEKNGATLATVAEDVKIKVVITSYYGDYYFGYTVGDELTIKYGGWPAYNDTEANLSDLKELLAGEQLGFVSESMSVGPGNGYVVAQNGRRLAVMSFENGNLYNYEIDSAMQRWLSEDMFYSVRNDELVVWDFDNTNERKLVAYRAKGDLGSVEGVNNELITNDDSGISSVTTISPYMLTDYEAVIADNNKWMYYVVRSSETGELMLAREMIRE